MCCLESLKYVNLVEDNSSSLKIKKGPEMPLDDLKRIKESADRIKNELKKVIKGVDKTIYSLVEAIFSRGHCLIEGPPGQGKTTLCLALSRTIGGKFIRFQGLPDALPSD